MNKMMITSMAARKGANIEAALTTTAVPVSKVDITGFANPPVVAEEANLPVAPAPLIAVAVPPPAIIAKDQVTTGSRLATVETMTAVPAIAAKGTATLSNRLSTHGSGHPKCYDGRKTSYPLPTFIEFPHIKIGSKT